MSILDLVHDDVYTKFGKIPSIFSEDIEQKPISDVIIKGCNSVANLQKMMLYNHNLDLVNDIVYTKFGKILSSFLKILSKTNFWRQSRAVTVLQICKI